MQVQYDKHYILTSEADYLISSPARIEPSDITVLSPGASCSLSALSSYLMTDLQKQNGVRFDSIGPVSTLKPVTGICDVDRTEWWIIPPAEYRVEIESSVSAVCLSENAPVEVRSECVFQSEYVNC